MKGFEMHSVNGTTDNDAEGSSPITHCTPEVRTEIYKLSREIENLLLFRQKPVTVAQLSELLRSKGVTCINGKPICEKFIARLLNGFTDLPTIKEFKTQTEIVLIQLS